MAKKVVDSELLINELMNMGYQPWATTPYSGSSYVNPDDLNGSLNALSCTINNTIARTVNDALASFTVALVQAIRQAERDEHDGLCGLCRTVPDFIDDQNV